jgi:hypothetical protein
MGEKRFYTRFWCGNIKERGHLKKLDKKGIILNGS